MKQFLSVLVAGLIAGSLSVSAFAADAAKPASASTAASGKAAQVVVKKDTGLKASVKKLFSSDSKKADVKPK